VTSVLRTIPGVASAYVFGSAASGRVHRESDLDIAVLLHWADYPNRRGRFEARLRLIAEVGAALHRNDIDLVILNDAPPHLARAIVTTGRRVACLDPETDHSFIRTAMLRAADLDPFLRRTRRTKLSALER
jgi:predicted nucleotidyltransferase